MVAYSFNARFAPRIAAGTKTQTIRADRRRHARPGELLQLFSGMRTRFCAKIMPDPLCIGVDPLALRFDAEGRIVLAAIDGVRVADLPAFALADGFDSTDDMADFWRRTHGLAANSGGHFIFRGVLIRWVPVLNVNQEPRQLRTANGQAVDAGPSVPPATGEQIDLRSKPIVAGVSAQ